jgi:chromosome transmission fidelity protein 18
VGAFFSSLLCADCRSTAARKKNAPGGKRPLLRPIICICNDLYSSALVRLRSIAKIIRFNKVSDVLMTKRLREICKFEKLKVDGHALSMLTRMGQGDIRSCINALQVGIRETWVLVSDIAHT